MRKESPKMRQPTTTSDKIDDGNNRCTLISNYKLRAARIILRPKFARQWSADGRQLDVSQVKSTSLFSRSKIINLIYVKVVIETYFARTCALGVTLMNNMRPLSPRHDAPPPPPPPPSNVIQRKRNWKL